MINGKQRIHTTLEKNTITRINDWEKEKGMSKNEIIENAILLMKEFCKKNNISPKEVKKFIKENGFGTNLGINLGEEFTTKISSITYSIYNGHELGLITIDFTSNGTTITRKFSEGQTDNVNMEKIFSNLYPRLYRIASQGNFISEKSAEKEKLPLCNDISQEKPIVSRILARDGTVLFDPDIPSESMDSNFGSSKLVKIAELLEKHIGQKNASTQEKIIYALLTKGENNGLPQTVVKTITGVDKKTLIKNIDNLKKNDLVFVNNIIDNKGQRNFVILNIDKIIQNGLPESKITNEEKIKTLLMEKGGVSQSEIAKKFKFSSKYTHKMIKAMEERGEITIGPDLKEKSVVIRLLETQKAEEIINREEIKIKPEALEIVKVQKEKPIGLSNDLVQKNQLEIIGAKSSRAPEESILDPEETKNSIQKTGPRDASPAEIAMKIDMMKRSALNFPNAPTSKSQVVNQSAPILTEVLLNDFSAESLHIFAEKYKGSGKYDEMVAYIAASLPAILKTREEEKEKIQPEKINTNPVAEADKLSSSEKKIKNALEVNGPLNRKQISEKTGISQPNLTGPLQKMKESGIVLIDAEKWPQVVSLKINEVIR